MYGCTRWRRLPERRSRGVLNVGEMRGVPFISSADLLANTEERMVSTLACVCVLETEDGLLVTLLGLTVDGWMVEDDSEKEAPWPAPVQDCWAGSRNMHGKRAAPSEVGFTLLRFAERVACISRDTYVCGVNFVCGVLVQLSTVGSYILMHASKSVLFVRPDRGCAELQLASATPKTLRWNLPAALSMRLALGGVVTALNLLS